MKVKFKVQNSKFKVIISLILLVIPLLYLSTSTQAAVCSSVSGDSRATGLVTAPTAEPLSRFGTSDTGACVIDIKAAFVPYKIPTYEDLKSLYYTQAKPPVTKTSIYGQLTSVFSTNDIIVVNGDLSETNYTPVNKVRVIFVEGNLIIGGNITYGESDANSGIVFIVKNNVYISPSVEKINGVIISSGTIYTASQSPGTACINSSVSFEDAAQTIMIKQLVINGSLISLNPSNPIEFCRSLGDNITPAEQINHQIKYLVILRNILSDTLQRWSEISADEEIPD